MTSGFPGTVAGIDPRGLTSVVNRMNLGKLNCTGSLTLQPNQAGTTVADSRVTATSFIGLSPLSASAAAELAAGTLFVAARHNGSFELAHAHSAVADRDFAYLVIG
jgi:hypothetical protein